MKSIIFILSLSILISCNSDEDLNISSKDFLPNNMSLWKVVDNTDNNEYYFLFPNDTLIIRYELRKFDMLDQSEGSDFHANQIFIQTKPKYYTYFHGHFKLDTEVKIKEHSNNANIELFIKYMGFNDSSYYLLEQVENFDNLPTDPRITYTSYVDKVYNDTMVRFSSKTLNNYLIYSFRGEDIDTLTLQVYNKRPNYSRLSESDTFFQAKENNKIYVVPKSSSFDSEILGSKGSFDVYELNKADSLDILKLRNMLDSLNR